ncbi:hypothetical protein TNCV_4710001 [Trichonephila clavipes]|nr:hypothetical protein TNCV_4710001 [Trichonephila clavipes]
MKRSIVYFVLCLSTVYSDTNVTRLDASPASKSDFGLNSYSFWKEYFSIVYQNVTGAAENGVFAKEKYRFLSEAQSKCLDDVKYIVRHLKSKWVIQSKKSSRYTKVPFSALGKPSKSLKKVGSDHPSGKKSLKYTKVPFSALGKPSKYLRKVGSGHPTVSCRQKECDTSQQAPLLSNYVQQQSDKCRTLLWPDVFTAYVAYSSAVLTLNPFESWPSAAPFRVVQGAQKLDISSKESCSPYE